MQPVAAALYRKTDQRRSKAHERAARQAQQRLLRSSHRSAAIENDKALSEYARRFLYVPDLHPPHRLIWVYQQCYDLYARNEVAQQSKALPRFAVKKVALWRCHRAG